MQTPEIMTLADFIATGAESTDLGRDLADEGLNGIPGRLYVEQLALWQVHDDGTPRGEGGTLSVPAHAARQGYPGEPARAPDWYASLEPHSGARGTLAACEAALYEYAARQGYLTKADAFTAALQIADLDEAVRTIMDPLGITDGGIAGVHLGGEDEAQRWGNAGPAVRATMLLPWLTDELGSAAFGIERRAREREAEAAAAKALVAAAGLGGGLKPTDDPDWPRYPANGQKKKFGDLSRAEQKAVVDAACLKLEREMLDPAFRRAVAGMLDRTAEDQIDSEHAGDPDFDRGAPGFAASRRDN